MQRFIYKTLNFIITVVFVSGGFTPLKAQERELKKADQATKEARYQDAIQWYEAAAEKGHQLTNKEHVTIASLYYALGAYQQAKEQYAMFYDAGYKDTPTSLLKYAHTLFITGDQLGYQKQLGKLQSLYPSDSRVLKLDDPFYSRNKKLFEEVHMLKDTILDVIQVVETPAGIFGSQLDQEQDRLVQLSSSNEATELYPDWKFNQGGMTSISDGTSLIVTLNEHKGNRLSFYDKTSSNLNLYRIDQNDGVWGAPVKLNININGYNSANPSWSSDGNWLYFVSDRPGGIGGTDIYRSKLLDNGNYGPAENLGKQINTEGRESYVFIDGSILYFSSDGYPGYGGMDVLATDLNDEQQKVFNLGAPINTPYDDFAYSRSNAGGYVSSNRLGQFASFEYVLTRDLVLSEEFDARLNIENKNLSLGAVLVVTVTDELGNEVWKKELEDLSHQITIPNLITSKDYQVALTGSHITPVTTTVTALQAGATVTVSLALESSISNIKALNEQVELSDILFDFDQYTTVVEDAVLATYVRVLSAAKSIHIQGFSDQRGLASYNKQLSVKRAEFFRDLLKEHGIAAAITVEGLGETKLRFNCREANCSDAMERQNRRVELLVTY